MLKSSEFNSAVPKFSNGNYASNPLDPTNIEEPSAQDYVRGTEPLDTLPAQWWNWLCNQFTSRFNKLNTYVKNIFDELTGFLSLLNISPDGTESAITTGQLKNAFKENYPAYINNKLELGTTYVKKTQKINNHALSGDVTISKADVGLGSVANTGDSANASSGGTTKFTTGGAYNLLSSIAPYFSTSTAYAVGALITYQNKLYDCKATHSAGAWNTSHFELANINNVSVDTDGKLALKADLLDLAPAFSTSSNYSIGSYVTYNGNLYRFKQRHSAGAWNATEVTTVTVGSQLNDTFLPYHREILNNSSAALTNKYILIFERVSAISNYSSPLQLQGTIGTIISTEKALINAEIDFRNASTSIAIKGSISDNISSIVDIIATYDTTTNTARIYAVLKTGYAYADIYSNNALLNTNVNQGVAEPVGNITASLTEVLVRTGKANMSNLAPAFSTSTSYVVGDYVTYNGNMYRCTVAHSGAWNASDFTLVTVGSDLELKADKTSLAVPTDAVLHYSFDEVPDYPDGTADCRFNKDFTTNWITQRATLSVTNGVLKVQATGTSSGQEYTGIRQDNFTSTLKGKICKVRIKIHQVSSDFAYFRIVGATIYNTITVSGTNQDKFIDLCFVIGDATDAWFLGVRFGTASTDNYFEIEELYIGDGSYTTPIIDNANGQNNATNNGGIAVQGVSGKGAYFLNGKYANIGDFNLNDNFTVSVWVNPADDTRSLVGNILNKSYQFALQNGPNTINVLIYQNGSYGTWQTTQNVLEKNKWTHVVLVKNGTSVILYLNGVLVWTITKSVTPIDKNSNNLLIGTTSNTRPQSIDDLLIFDRALSEDEVMALYLNKANTPKYYDINNYILDNTDSTPTQNSTDLVTSGGVYTELAKKVDKTTTVNGHALSGNVTVTKADLDLDNVVNTGDSAIPVENGTAKFTTGGAYDFFAKKDNYNDWLETVFGWSMGTSWSKTSFDNPSSIGYGNGIFVTIGYSGSSYYHFYWSTDGKAWTQGDAADSYLNSCYFNGNLFVAVTDLHAYWSTDGKTWTQGSGTGFNMGNSASSVYYANNIWVITGSDRHTYWSTDGKTWTLQNSNLSMYGHVVRYANGLWVIGGSNALYWSTDGKTWTQGSGLSSSYGLCYGNGIWITLSAHNGYKSTDGKTWTEISLGGSGGNSSSIYFSNGIWIYTSSTSTGGQGVVTRSIDGENWERVTTGLSGSDHSFGSVICKNGIWIVTDGHFDAIYSSSYRSLLPNYGN